MDQILHTLKLPDFVTLFNALCGIVAIIIVLKGFTYIAPLLILIAAVADGIDGHIARRFKSSEIGGNLDSLADMISFGAAPVVITYVFSGNEMHHILLAALLFYFVCGMLRLARFNTMQLSPDSFRGLPITAGGIAISSYLLTGNIFFNIYSIIGIFLILGILMVSEITYFKARNKKILLPLAIIFAATIISYVVNIQYTHFMATLLSAIMVIYVISPLLLKNNEVKNAGEQSNH